MSLLPKHVVEGLMMPASKEHDFRYFALNTFAFLDPYQDGLFAPSSVAFNIV